MSARTPDRTILILSAGFGQGHNAAARNLRDALQNLAPTRTVLLRDPFLESNGWLQKLAQKTYLATIAHAPALWRACYWLIDRTPIIPWQTKIHVQVAARLEALLQEYQPTVVVSTFPGNNHLLDHVCQRRVCRPFQTFTIITDSLTINSTWLTAHSDLYLVANAPTADVLREAGVPEERIRVTGFPVPLVFARQKIGRTLPTDGDRWRVLLLAHSGHQNIPAMVRLLLQVDDLSLTVAVGRDESLGHRLRREAAGQPLEILGWVPERLPELMAESHLLITKAGGATVQEALAVGTPLIVTKVVPGQEEGNARLVVDHGAGALAFSPEAVAGAVEAAFQNAGTQWKSWQAAAQSLGHPTASLDIARLILKF